MAVKYSIVVAACENFGIGNKNDLPWPPIPTDQKFFQEVSSQTKNPKLRNVVILGRRTYESIPEHERPLKNRINVIISQSYSTPPAEGVYLATSFDEALKIAKSLQDSGQAEGIHIAGGQGIYETALQRPECERIYFTKVYAKFDADTFFPDPESLTDYQQVDDQKRREILEGFSCVPRPVDNDVVENGIRYRFFVYERKANH